MKKIVLYQIYLTKFFFFSCHLLFPTTPPARRIPSGAGGLEPRQITTLIPPAHHLWACAIAFTLF